MPHTHCVWVGQGVQVWLLINTLLVHPEDMAAAACNFLTSFVHFWCQTMYV
jgi:hypothetical protein